MKNGWSIWLWALAFAPMPLLLPKLFRFLRRWVIGFRVTGEGLYIRSNHICFSYPKGEKSEYRKMCCRYVYLKERPEGKEEKVCIVRNICEIPFKEGAHIRVSYHGSGRYKVEELKDPA